MVERVLVLCICCLLFVVWLVGWLLLLPLLPSLPLLLPYLLLLGEHGLEAALTTHPGLSDGVNVYQGKIASETVAKALGLETGGGA